MEKGPGLWVRLWQGQGRNGGVVSKQERQRRDNVVEHELRNVLLVGTLPSNGRTYRSIANKDIHTKSGDLSRREAKGLTPIDQSRRPVEVKQGTQTFPTQGQD